MILWISQILIPLTVCYIIGFGLLSGRPVFDDFLEGAASGMKTGSRTASGVCGTYDCCRCSEKLWPIGDSGTVAFYPGWVAALADRTGSCYAGASGIQLGCHRASVGSV